MHTQTLNLERNGNLSERNNEKINSHFRENKKFVKLFIAHFEHLSSLCIRMNGIVSIQSCPSIVISSIQVNAKVNNSLQGLINNSFPAFSACMMQRCSFVVVRSIQVNDVITNSIFKSLFTPTFVQNYAFNLYLCLEHYLHSYP